jgi:hypothetical protein
MPAAAALRAPSPAAVRARRTRRRHKVGVTVYRVPVHEHRLAAALIASRRLSDAQALDRSQVERELAGLVEDWITRWVDRHA